MINDLPDVIWIIMSEVADGCFWGGGCWCPFGSLQSPASAEFIYATREEAERVMARDKPFGARVTWFNKEGEV